MALPQWGWLTIAKLTCWVSGKNPSSLGRKRARSSRIGATNPRESTLQIVCLCLSLRGLTSWPERRNRSGTRAAIGDWTARLIDSCNTQLNDQGPSRTCCQSEEEEEGSPARPKTGTAAAHAWGIESCASLVRRHGRSGTLQCLQWIGQRGWARRPRSLQSV